MDVQGERECLDCGERWSYWDTRTVECPECGSPRSRGVGDGARPEEEFTAEDLDDTDLAATLENAEEAARSYTTKKRFVVAGDLRPPDPVYVMATEVKHLAAEHAVRDEGFTDDEREYAVALVTGLEEGEPPHPDERPESLDAVHERAVADVVEDYGGEVVKWARDRDLDDTDVMRDVEDARQVAKQVKATEGEEGDAVEALRTLRDVYEGFEEIRG